MSSCAASCSTCCHAASCVFATSDFLPTDGEQNFFHSVSDCSSNPISQQLLLPCRPRYPRTRCGTVRSAAEPCRWSSASSLRNSSSDLRLISAGAQHESTSPTSNLPRAPARTLVLRLAFPKMQYRCALPTFRCGAPRPFSRRSPTETEMHRQQRQPCKRSEPAHPYTNPIVLGAASFKSLYLKRPFTAP